MKIRRGDRHRCLYTPDQLWAGRLPGIDSRYRIGNHSYWSYPGLQFHIWSYRPLRLQGFWEMETWDIFMAKWIMTPEANNWCNKCITALWTTFCPSYFWLKICKRYHISIPNLDFNYSIRIIEVDSLFGSPGRCGWCAPLKIQMGNKERKKGI